MRKMAPLSQNASLARQAESYWVQSRRPLASLLFVAPLLIAYEVGVLLLGVQNGADAFMRWLLSSLGFGQHFLLPLLLVCILLSWHHLAHQPWRLSGSVFSGMLVESVMLGLCLRVIVFLQHVAFDVLSEPAAASIGGMVKSAVGFLVRESTRNCCSG